MPTDAELAKTFVGRVTGDKKYAPNLERLVETILGAHRKGDKSTEKSAAKAFVDGLPTNFGPKEQAGTLKLLTGFVKKNARFTYAAAFAKKKTEIKKILGFAKKGNQAKVDSEIQSLYSSMRSSGEIPKTAKFGHFDMEIRERNKDLVFDGRAEPAMQEKKLTMKDMKKYDFGKFMSQNKINKKDLSTVHELAVSVWNKGEKDKKSIADAERLIESNGLKQGSTKKLVEGVKKAMLETFL